MEVCDVSVGTAAYAGTTRECFEDTLFQSAPRDQAAVLRAILEDYPPLEVPDPDQPKFRTEKLHREILSWISRLETGTTSVQVAARCRRRNPSDGHSTTPTTSCGRPAPRVRSTACTPRCTATCSASADDAGIAHGDRPTMNQLFKALRAEHPSLAQPRRSHRRRGQDAGVDGLHPRCAQPGPQQRIDGSSEQRAGGRGRGGPRHQHRPHPSDLLRREAARVRCMKVRRCGVLGRSLTRNHGTRQSGRRRRVRGGLRAAGRASGDRRRRALPHRERDQDHRATWEVGASTRGAQGAADRRRHARAGRDRSVGRGLSRRRRPAPGLSPDNGTSSKLTELPPCSACDDGGCVPRVGKVARRPSATRTIAGWDSSPSPSRASFPPLQRLLGGTRPCRSHPAVGSKPKGQSCCPGNLSPASAGSAGKRRGSRRSTSRRRASATKASIAAIPSATGSSERLAGSTWGRAPQGRAASGGTRSASSAMTSQASGTARSSRHGQRGVGSSCGRPGPRVRPTSIRTQSESRLASVDRRTAVLPLATSSARCCRACAASPVSGTWPSGTPPFGGSSSTANARRFPTISGFTSGSALVPQAGSAALSPGSTASPAIGRGSWS